MAIGGERQVERVAFGGAQARQFLNQLDQAAAQQRLAAGEANLVDAQVHEQLDQPQVLFDRQFGILRAEFAGPAVDALVVAAVGDGDAQIVDHPAVAVGQAASGRFCGGCDWGSSSHRHLQAIPFSASFAGAQEH